MASLPIYAIESAKLGVEQRSERDKRGKTGIGEIYRVKTHARDERSCESDKIEEQRKERGNKRKGRER